MQLNVRDTRMVALTMLSARGYGGAGAYSTEVSWSFSLPRWWSSLQPRASFICLPHRIGYARLENSRMDESGDVRTSPAMHGCALIRQVCCLRRLQVPLAMGSKWLLRSKNLTCRRKPLPVWPRSEFRRAFGLHWTPRRPFSDWAHIRSEGRDSGSALWSVSQSRDPLHIITAIDSASVD